MALPCQIGLKKCCIFKCCIFSKVPFWVPFYLQGTSVKHSSSLLSYRAKFLPNELCLRRVFLGFRFSVGIFWGFLSVAKYFSWVV